MILKNAIFNPFFYIYCLTCFFQGYVTGKMFTLCFKSKLSNGKTIMLIVIGASVIPIINKVTSALFPPFLGLICPIIFCCFITYGSKIKITFFFIINLLLESITEIILHILANVLNKNFTMDEFNSERVIFSLLFIFISSPVKYIFAKMWNKIVNKKYGERLNYFYIVFPFAQSLAYTAMMLRYVHYDFYSFHTSGYVIASMMIFASSDIIFLIFISDFEKKRTLEQEIKIIKYARLFEEQHYKEIEQKRFEAAKLNHDIKNQIVIMKKLINIGKINEVEQLINELEKNIDSTKEYD